MQYGFNSLHRWKNLHRFSSVKRKCKAFRKQIFYISCVTVERYLALEMAVFNGREKRERKWNCYPSNVRIGLHTECLPQYVAHHGTVLIIVNDLFWCWFEFGNRWWPQWKRQQRKNSPPHRKQSPLFLFELIRCFFSPLLSPSYPVFSRMFSQQ